MFEISYAGALVDSTSRRTLIGNACAAVRVTGGKNTIISSGATSAMVRERVSAIPVRESERVFDELLTCAPSVRAFTLSLRS